MTKWYLIQTKHWRAPYWAQDVHGFWKNTYRGKSLKDKKDKIFETIEVENCKDLDWIKTGLLRDWDDCGWLRRDGKWYGCDTYNHVQVAWLILHQSEAELERAGWCRVWRAPENSGDEWICSHRLSVEQRNWLLFRGHLITEWD